LSNKHEAMSAWIIVLAAAILIIGDTHIQHSEPNCSSRWQAAQSVWAGGFNHELYRG
jgi:hypothetical protein